MFLFAVFLFTYSSWFSRLQCQFLKMKFLSQQYQRNFDRYVCGRECTRVIEMIAQYITSHWTTWPLSLVDDRNSLSFERYRGARILSACHAYLGRNRRDCDGGTGRRGIPLSFHFLGKLIASYRVSFTGIRTTHPYPVMRFITPARISHFRQRESLATWRSSFNAFHNATHIKWRKISSGWKIRLETTICGSVDSYVL